MNLFQGEKVQVVDSFRKYSSLEESFLDFGRFLNQNPRYALALQEKDPERFAKALQAAGYAYRFPEYADKLHIYNPKMGTWETNLSRCPNFSLGISRDKGGYVQRSPSRIPGWGV